MKASLRNMAMGMILAFAIPIRAAHLRARQTAQDTSEGQSAIAMQQLQQLMAEETRFFTAEWASLQDQLLRLEAAVEPKLVSANADMPMSLNLKNSVELAPAIAMLKGLYEECKRRIAELNGREQKYKAHFEEREKQHNATISRIKARFANHTLNAEFRTNETRTEMRLFTYWSKDRERSHSSFHTGLKIQHGMLAKVKNMMDMYEKAMSGKPDDAKQVKAALSKMATPEVVFLQERQSVVRFCRDSLAEVRNMSAELKQHPLVQSSQ